MNIFSQNFIFIVTIFFFIPLSSAANTSPNLFYSIDHGKIEIRSIAPEGESSTMKLTNMNKREFNLTSPPLLSSMDFEGIAASDSVIVLYLKKGSWQKARKVTARYINKELSIAINDMILSVAVVREPLSRAVQIPRNSSDTIFTENFFRGFTVTQKPAYLDNPEVYKDFLEKWINENPDDFPPHQELAMLYLTDSSGSINTEMLTQKTCEKAIPLFKTLIKRQPSELYYYSNLSACYLAYGNHDLAISTLEASIPYCPENQKWTTYSQIGLAYMMHGSYDKALAALEKSKTLLKTSQMLPEGINIEMAQMFFAVASPPAGNGNFKTVKEFEQSLKKDGLQQIERLVQQVKESKK